MGLYNRDYMRTEGGWRGGAGRPPLIGWLIILCVAVFVFQMIVSGDAFGAIAIPGSVTWAQVMAGEVWRLFTYAFVHGNALHLIVNMLWLWIIGRVAADDLGNRHIVGLFFCGAVAGAMADLPVYPDYPLVGASAGIWALMIAVTVRYPDLPVGFPFLPGVTLRLKNLTIGFLIFEVISATAQFFTRNNESAIVLQREHVASLAHLGGALAGWIYARVLTGGFSAMVRQSEERERWWHDHRTRRREPSRVVAGRRAVHSTAGEPASVDFIEEVVNPILEKLHANGPASLSPEEQRILDDAARRLKQSGRG